RRREAIICATSVGLGLGVAFEPEIFNQLPLLFQNPICMGGITAVVLNLILPQDEQEQVGYIEDNLEI
ncbi:MAG: xanthine permease, partial [Oligella ureolytica]|nr:xanthine permease [Oligella ureolytica]